MSSERGLQIEATITMSVTGWRCFDQFRRAPNRQAEHDPTLQFTLATMDKQAGLLSLAEVAEWNNLASMIQNFSEEEGGLKVLHKLNKPHKVTSALASHTEVEADRAFSAFIRLSEVF